MPSGSFGRMRESGIALPTGQHQELRGDIPTDPDGTPPLAEEKWTDGMRRVAGYANSLAKELIGEGISTIEMYVMPVGTGWKAGFGKDQILGIPLGNRLIFNVTVLGHTWFNEPDREAVDELLIHEFAHRTVENHLSDDFHRACCRLGAKLRDCHGTL
jgi:hypothetical protein